MNTRRSGGMGAGVGGVGSGNMEHTHSFTESKPDLYPINKKICHLVELFPCMYDRSNPHYLKKDAIEKAWERIAKEMNDSVPSCKERWRNIRTSFARSINVRKIPASANRTKPYYLHEELKFLTQHITPGIPVPPRRPGKKSTSSRHSTLYGDDEESQEVKVSMSEESFDSFAAHAQENARNNSNDDEEDSNEDADNEQGSRTHSGDDNSTLGGDISMPQTSFDPQHMANHNNNNNNIDSITTKKDNSPVAATTTLAAVVQTTNVCPCPPKKRQRLIETEVIEIPDYSPMVEIEMHTPQQQQQQQQLPISSTSSQQKQQQQAPQAVESGVTTTTSTSHSSINHNNVSSDVDFDDAFLQGLRPEMKAMNFQQKLYFKCRIYDMLKEIYPHTNNLESSSAQINNVNTTILQQSSTATSLFPTVIVPTEGGNTFNANNMMHRLETSSSSTTLSSPKAPILTKVNIVDKNHNGMTTGQIPPTLLMPPRLRAVGRPTQVSTPPSKTPMASSNIKASSLPNGQHVKDEPLDQSDLN